MKQFKIGKRNLPQFHEDLQAIIANHGAYVRQEGMERFYEEFFLVTREELVEMMVDASAEYEHFADGVDPSINVEMVVNDTIKAWLRSEQE